MVIHKGIDYVKTIDISLGELYLKFLKVHDKKVLQIDAETGEELTAVVLLNKAILLAKWLRNHGMGPGDCLSISSENNLDFVVVVIASLFTGITIAPVNSEYKKGEAKHVIDLSKPTIIFCSPKTVSLMISEKSNFPFLKKIILFGKDRINNIDVDMFEDIVGDARNDVADESFSPTVVDPEQCVAVILCSSGTTGLPKGVMTTYSNITALIEILKVVYAWKDPQLSSQNEVTTGLSPFFHTMGFMVMILCVLRGFTLIVHSRFHPKQFLESIQKYKINRLSVVPPILLFLKNHPMVKDFDLSSVTKIGSGAAPIGKDLERGVMERLKNSTFSQSFGMTETTATLLGPGGGNNHKSGSVGKVVPGMSCKVVDEEGNILGPHKAGELCFKGPLIMKGYVNNPEATAEVFDRNNWFHSGDVGYYDQDGDFFIVDRLKELIKYNGFQVAPAELEGLLLTHPAIKDAAVVGIQDDRSGELPSAFVVKKSTHSVTSQEIQKFIAELVSPAKQLRGGVTFVKEIPKSVSGKILRRMLRETANKCKSKL